MATASLPLVGDATLPGLVGGAPSFAAAVERASTAGRVLVVSGERGTGKRTLARAVHLARTGRDDGLVDAAHLDRARLDPSCTVVASDVVDLGGGVQQALAAVLRDGTAHVVLCTEARPAEAVAAGRLRPDLVAVAGTVSVRLPPLRERRGDVARLVAHFLGSFCSRRCGCLSGVTPAAIAALDGYAFPGNVAELRTIVERAVTCGTGSCFGLADLPDEVRACAPSGEVDDEPPIPTLADAETELVRRALARHDGNKARAARALGISRQRLYDKLRRIGLH